jgi:hypothetical protein
LSILVRLGNIVYPSPLEAVSILVHMAFVYPRTHPRGRIPKSKLHARGGCCPVAVAGYQTATCSGRIPNCMHAAAVALLQWQDTKLPLAVAGYQTACMRRLLPCCSGRIPNCHLQWQDTKLHVRGGCGPAAVAGYQTACARGCSAVVSGY